MKKLQKSEFLNNSGGILDVLKVALPLILSASCHAVNMFMDRLMLTRYSQPSAAAAMTSGLTCFTLQCFFVGVVGYAGTFVAQYAGANQPKRIGTAVWQGIFMAFLGGCFMIGLSFFAPWFFSRLNHPEAVVYEEVTYFRLLSWGSGAMLLMNALSCFWSGRGKTHLVMIVSVFTTILNLPLNYMLIYGKWGFSEMGTAGAAWGTVLASLGGVAVYAIGFWGLPSSRRHYETLKSIFDWEMFRRLLKFGSPNGVQLFLDLSAFNLFILLVSMYGVKIQEASSIVFGINNVAFCPCMGIGMTASILVGQAVGAKDISHAKKSVRSARALMIFYMTLMILLFTLSPDTLLQFFIRQGDTGQQEVMRLAKIMFFFIAAYLFGDGMALVYSNAIRGAGDTRYPMVLTIVVSWAFFALPCLAWRLLGFSVWVLWGNLTGYILIFGLLCYLRYCSGKWAKMRVIEDF